MGDPFHTSATEPRDRGRAFGQAQATQVASTVASYQRLFERRGPGFDVRRWAGAFRDAIGDLAPDLLAEIEGIAEGAGLDPLDVVALNARTEILAKIDPTGASECSAVAVVPAHGRPFGVQTWDWYDDMAGGWLRWRMATKNPDGATGWVDTVTEYGLLAKIGLNDRGVGVLLTILHHAADENDETGLPVHLLARRLLAEAATVEDALVLARATPVAASTSLTVLDGTTAVGLELFPGGPGELRPDADGLIVRTNHFLSAAGAPGCLTRESYPSTNVRCDWLDQVLHDAVPAGPADVLAAMRHHDPAGGVCRHPDAALAPELRTATLATVTIAPPELTVQAGGPCGRA